MTGLPDSLLPATPAPASPPAVVTPATADEAAIGWASAAYSWDVRRDASAAFTVDRAGPWATDAMVPAVADGVTNQMFDLARTHQATITVSTADVTDPSWYPPDDHTTAWRLIEVTLDATSADGWAGQRVTVLLELEVRATTSGWKVADAHLAGDAAITVGQLP